MQQMQGQNAYVEYVTDPADPDYQTGYRVYGYWGYMNSSAVQLDPNTMYSARPGTEVLAHFLPASRKYGELNDPQGMEYPTLCEGENPADFNFFEASSMRKIAGKYYFVYSSVLGHELCYAVGDAPDGPFTYGGTLVSNGDVGLEGHTDPKTASNDTGNTHGGMLELDGRLYIFYHRQTNRHCYARQACAEQLFPRADGSIPQAEITSCGLNGGPLKGEGTYEARIACNLYSKGGGRFLANIFKARKGTRPYFTQTGGDRNGDPDQYIANFCDGATAGFKYFDLRGLKRIGVTLQGSAEGEVLVQNALGGEVLCRIPVTGAQTRRTFYAPYAGKDGVQPLFFTFRGTGKAAFYSISLAR